LFRKSLLYFFLALFSSVPVQGDTLDSRVGQLEFKAGYPAKATVEKLYDELDFQRAVQAYLWALPMASYGAMSDAHRAVGANSHTVIIADKLAQPRNVALTANQDTVYMSGAFDLREGKFLILPPGYDGPLPETHHHVVRSDTNIVVFDLRAIPQTREDIPKLVELIQTYRQYKLEEAAAPPETRFVSLAEKDTNFLTNEGFAYFETLARYINENPPRAQDMAMLGMLESLGIVHGKPFEPNKRMKKILTEAATVGRAMAETLAYVPRVPTETLYPYPGERRWKRIFFSDPTFHEPEYMAIDLRAKEPLNNSRSVAHSMG
jgi:hypothetical protein